jgi:hypothetical protein
MVGPDLFLVDGPGAQAVWRAPSGSDPSSASSRQSSRSRGNLLGRRGRLRARAPPGTATRRERRDGARRAGWAGWRGPHYPDDARRHVLGRDRDRSDSVGGSDRPAERRIPVVPVRSAERLSDRSAWNGGPPDSPPGGASPGPDCSRDTPTASGRPHRAGTRSSRHARSDRSAVRGTHGCSRPNAGRCSRSLRSWPSPCHLRPSAGR